MDVAVFWDFFVKNEQRIFNFDTDLEILNKLQSYLDNYSKGLSFEISDEENNVRDFIISAGGDENLFCVVDELVNKSPSLPRWKIIALKPANGFDFSLQIGELLLNPKEIFFDPLKSSKQPDKLGIRIIVPSKYYVDDIKSIITLILQTGLGERQQCQIKHVEISSTDNDSSKFIPLVDLPDYIRWFLKKNRS